MREWSGALLESRVVSRYGYYELEWFGSVWIPEDLDYIILKFSTAGSAEGAWGKDVGRAA